MATATEADLLAAAIHRTLATLTDLRSPTATPEVLQARIALVRWLRQELAAVETLLAAAAERSGGSGSSGTVTAPGRW